MQFEKGEKMETYYITKIKTIFLKDNSSEMHGEFSFHKATEFEGTINDLKDYCIKIAKINPSYKGSIVLTVYYFDYEDGLEDYNSELLQKLESEDEDCYISEPSEKTWLINQEDK